MTSRHSTSSAPSNPGLRRGSTAARLLGSWVRIPPGAWMSVSCECCVLSGRGLCDGLVIRPEKSYLVWCVYCVWSWNLEMTRPRPPKGCWAIGKKKYEWNKICGQHWTARTRVVLQRLTVDGESRNCQPLWNPMIHYRAHKSPRRVPVRF
jgi:hypothetical protein